MELRELRYFAAAVRAGSLTGGAAALNIAQPSLSVAIGRLESQLGVQLLTRSSRGIEPTSAGRYLLRASSRVLEEVDEIAQQLRRHGSGATGSITLAAVPVLMWHKVPLLLRAHALATPGVDVRLIDPPPWTAIDLLQNRRVDLAAIVVAETSRFAQGRTPEFEVFDWGSVPLVAALPRGAAGVGPEEPIPLGFFGGKRMVLPHRISAVPSLPEVVEGVLREHAVTPAAVVTVETIQASIPLIEAGLAMAILPDPDRQSLARFDFDVHPLLPEPPALRGLLLARPGATDDPVLARLLNRLLP